MSQNFQCKRLLNICVFSDDNWDDNDAKVVCKMLGFNAEYAVATNKSEYGNVEPNFIMDEVKCNGNEETLEDCEHNLTHDCKGKEAAGVICSETRITTQRNEEDLTTPRSSNGFGQDEICPHVGPPG